MKATCQNKCPLISVVVPIYGVEKYIARCARSLFQQSKQEYVEYIFVNDGTQDNSMQILFAVINEYPGIIEKVKFIHHESNKGLPAARETGIRNSSGSYIMHVDSDDWVMNNAFSTIIDDIGNSFPDIIIYDYQQGTEKKLSIVHQDIILKNYIGDMLSHKISCCLWNKIIKKSLYQDVQFAKYGMGEDLFLIYQLCLKATFVIHSSNYWYNYYDAPCSMSRNTDPIKRYRQFYELKQNTDELEKIIQMNGYYNKYSKYLDVHKLAVKNILLPIINYKTNFYAWKKTYSDINIKILINEQVDIKTKIRHIMTMLHLYGIKLSLNKIFYSTI